MGWLENIKKFKNDIYLYHRREAEDHREYAGRSQKMKMHRGALRIRKRDLMRQLQFLRRLQRNSGTDEQIELLKNITKIEAELNELHLKQHVNPFGKEDADFNQYYRHIRFTRPFVLIFNLALWFLLFWFGGVGAGLKIVILLFALMTTFGSIFEMIFMIRIKDRILKPVDNLQKAVNEVAKGNYDVTVAGETTNEIASLIKAFNEMARGLAAAEKIKSEYEENRKALVANISHDLKTPITSIQGYVEAVVGDTGIPREKLDRYLKIIRSNSSYMNSLIDDLFLFSKLDMQKLDFHFETVGIKPFIADMMEEFSLDLGEKNAVFEFTDTLAREYDVKLDAKRFYQIIRNIIDNAVKHGPDTLLKIEAKLYEAGGFICIDITDNGPGIPEESLGHIFDRFYRVGTERTKDLSSTGLGLAIAKELVQAHGGKIAVSAAEGGGSRFTVAIPYIGAGK
jgi:signal transduction histidine kinase